MLDLTLRNHNDGQKVPKKPTQTRDSKGSTILYGIQLVKKQYHHPHIVSHDDVLWEMVP